ncbi:replication protein [Jeotgalibaca porci]|uniref:replication protein n=1 Tax=Jeotgalibaca porci TaxID=1868793 RepID=UPI00359FB309
MAQRRMLSKQITETDMFMDMPLSAQALYLHLIMNADDDGFIGNAKTILRMVGGSNDDLKLLIAKQFIITFDDGITVIRDWRIHNYIQKDRYHKTIYGNHLSELSTDSNGSYSKENACIQDVSKMDTQVRLGKVRLGKDSKKNSCKSPTYNADNLNYKAAVYFWKKIQDVFPKAKKPNLQNWANDVRLMHEQDKRSYDEIKAVIDWVNQDDFWVGNILSPKKLRKQYDALTIQMTRKGKPKTAAYKNPTEISDDDLPF